MLKISLCMIVKDEEKNIDRCLKNANSIVNEIIIVDTGSTDGTIKVVSSYTDKIYEYQWNNDFGMARNAALKHANNEFVLVLDADEIVINCDKSAMINLIEEHPDKVGRILLYNEFTRQGQVYRNQERVGRVFSKEYYQYEGIIHEQLVSNIGNEKKFYDVPLEILHLGYNGDIGERRKKAGRNIALLIDDLHRRPDDTYILYQIGKGYYMMEEYIIACDFFEQALEYDLDVNLEYVQDMIETYGYSLINTGQYERAKLFLNIYDEFSHSSDFIFLVALILMNNGNFDEAIKEFQKAARKKTCKVEGVNSFLAFYNIGVICECRGDIVNAKYYYEKCGDYKPALIRMNII